MAKVGNAFKILAQQKNEEKITNAFNDFMKDFFEQIYKAPPMYDIYSVSLLLN